MKTNRLPLIDTLRPWMARLLLPPQLEQQYRSWLGSPQQSPSDL
jgi:hypothetical protein